MNFTLKTLLVKNTFYIVYQEEGETEQRFKTPLDKLGCDLMVENIKTFVYDFIDDDVNPYIQLDGNDGTEGIIVDMYDDIDDGEPVDTKTFWFEDYSA